MGTAQQGRSPCTRLSLRSPRGRFGGFADSPSDTSVASLPICHDTVGCGRGEVPAPGGRCASLAHSLGSFGISATVSVPFSSGLGSCGRAIGPDPSCRWQVEDLHPAVTVFLHARCSRNSVTSAAGTPRRWCSERSAPSHRSAFFHKRFPSTRYPPAASPRAFPSLCRFAFQHVRHLPASFPR